MTREEPFFPLSVAAGGRVKARGAGTTGQWVATTEALKIVDDAGQTLFADFVLVATGGKTFREAYRLGRDQGQGRGGGRRGNAEESRVRSAGREIGRGQRAGR